MIHYFDTIMLLKILLFTIKLFRYIHLSDSCIPVVLNVNRLTHFFVLLNSYLSHIIAVKKKIYIQ